MLDKIVNAMDIAGGAVARRLKQFPVIRKPIPEVPSEEDHAVKAYLSGNSGILTYEDIARGSGVPQHRVGNIVRKLVESKLVEKQTIPRQGSRYQIIGGGPNPSKVTQTTEPDIEEDIDFVKISEELIFKFVRATRSTDVLLYLTWLERQGEKSDE